jgi:hypothetical protein
MTYLRPEQPKPFLARLREHALVAAQATAMTARVLRAAWDEANAHARVGWKLGALREMASIEREVRIATLPEIIRRI